MIDIGANIGYDVVIAAQRLRQNGRIFAIEPGPKNVAILHENLLLNDLENMVDVECAAISSDSGFSTLWISRSSNLHTLTRTRETETYTKFVGRIRIRTFSLDDFLLHKHLQPEDADLIRMDVEGHKVEVIRGMRRFLDQGDRLKLFVEIHPKLIKAQGKGVYEEFLSDLAERGFSPLLAFSRGALSDEPVQLDTVFDLLRFHEAAAVILTRE